jgi:hypothetical protein
MLFNFLGSPQSGKTTTAAMTFASLKEIGLVSEFSSEQARLYIAQQRVLWGYGPEDKVTLTDQDQVEIMRRQLEMDETLVKACGPEVFIISDSSPVNSMLYMSPEARRRGDVLDMYRRSKALTTGIFYMHPIYRGWSDQRDPNRIHDYEQSQLIDKLIPEFLKEDPELNDKTIAVLGTTVERLLTVKTRIFR